MSNDQTKRDTAKAAARTYKSGGTKNVQDQISTGKIETGKPSTMADRERDAGLGLAGGDTTAGRDMDDPFYALEDTPAPPPATQDMEIYADDGGALPASSGGGITGIICINGELFNATIQGSIGAPVSP